MKRISAVLFCLMALGETPAHAQLIVGSVISGVQAAQEEAYEAFMKIQIVQQLEVLRQNYQASVNYYQQFQQLNAGRGLAFNVGQQLKTSEDQSIKQMSQQLLNSYNGNTATTQLVQSVNQTIYNDLQYTGSEMANVISNRQTGVNVAQNAGSLSPKDAENLTAQSQGLLIQMLTQIHQDNLRLIQLVSMQLAGQNTQQTDQNTQISDITQSVQSRYPSAQINTSAVSGTGVSVPLEAQ